MWIVSASRPSGPRRQPGASAMPAAQPPFPIYVLNCVVDTADLTGKPEPGRGRAWSEIPCASRRAYGCGNNIQEAVEGLVLYARLDDAPHLNSSLAIRMSEGARRRFELELDPDYYRRRDAKLPSDLIGIARVEMAEEHGITAIILCFTRPGFLYHQSDLVYYLVYDSISRSLSMFHKCVCDDVCSLKTVVPKRTDGGDDYKLFLLGHKVSSPKDDVLWVGSLSSSDCGTGVPAKLKSMDFPRGLIHKRFKVDVAFSCQRKAFWGDLKQGLLYYDLQTSDFGFIKIPREYKVDMDSGGDEPVPPVTYSRTMGCVGDSIWFVCIDVPSHYTNAVVCIWELVLPEEQEQEQVKGKGAGWKEVVEEVPAKVLWELSSFKKAGLPAAPLQYPILTPDGALCFVLVDQSRFQNPPPFEDHFCIFDMRYKRLLWHGLVRDYPITESIIMYPSSSFLDNKQCSLQRSSAEDCRAAGLEAMTWSKLSID